MSVGFVEPSEGSRALNIILVSGATARARTITLDWRHWTRERAVLVVRCSSPSRCCSTTRRSSWAAAVKHPWLQAIVLADQREEAQRTQEQVQGHLNAMAVKLGELQAQMMRLEGLGDRLAKVAGLKPQELPASGAPGRGGAGLVAAGARPVGARVRGARRQAGARRRPAHRPARRARGAARADLGEPQVPSVAEADRRRLALVELRLPDRPVHAASAASTRASTSRRRRARRSWPRRAARSSTRAGTPSMVK